LSNTLENIYYTKDHEWVNIDNGIATVGITDYAQNELGDIIFVEFPIIGSKYKIGDVIGTIEAVKTVADLYSPIEGIIMKINSLLEDEPGSINKDPYGNGWLVKLSYHSVDLATLLNIAEYNKLIK